MSFLRNFLEPFSYLIYAIALFLEHIKHKSFGKKVLFFYYLTATFIISYACVVALDDNDNNNWIYNIHYFLYSITLACYFDQLLAKSYGKVFAKILLAIVLIIFLVTDINSYPFFNSVGNAIFFLYVVLCSLIYFNQILHNVNENNILAGFDFWLVSGYVIYFLGSFFIILSYNYFTNKVTEEQKVILGDLWSIQNVLLLISAIIALFGHLWTAYQEKLH